MTDTAETLIAYCRDKDRVCPQPTRWSQLWEMLPNRHRVDGGWQPPLPLILAAWHDTPALLKTLRLAEHIEWAAKHQALHKIAAFVRGLREDEWCHLGQ